jgi:hypothetical protein
MHTTTHTRRASPLADTVERHELAIFTRWGLGAWLLTSGTAGCVDMVPPTPSATSEQLTERLPDTPAPAPARIEAPPPGSPPLEVTMHQLRGTPEGVRVDVRGFFGSAGGTQVQVFADSELDTLKLVCDGPGADAAVDWVRETPVRVVGTVSQTQGEALVLVDCEVARSGDAPVDTTPGGPKDQRVEKTGT